MHSLKNTVIAVCLLGLSFAFFQATSKSPSDDTELFPTVNMPGESDSAEIDVTQMTPAPMRLAPRSSELELPPINSGPALENLSDELGNTIDENPLLPNTAVPQLLLPGIESPARQTVADPPSSSPQFGNQQFGSQDMTSEARDQGLIAALETQNQNPPTRELGSLAPSTEFPPRLAHQPIAPLDHSNELDSANNGQPFAAQNAAPTGGNHAFPSMDSSFNQQVSTAPDMASNQNVINADRSPDFSEFTYTSVWPEAERLAAEGDYRSALQLLSRFYDSPEVSGPQVQKLFAWLDALAGKVIFSSEHRLESPYVVGANESLADVGQQWGIPAQLVYNINRQDIPNPMSLPPGTQLKTIKGPFRAVIDLQDNTMTLFLGDLYAGRYSIRVGISGTPSPGDFEVMVKSEEGHDWYDVEKNSYAPESPQNGYGRNWIGLTGSLCIHAVSEDKQDGHHGCIGLTEQDAKDVFAILAEGSQVTIVR